MPFRGTQLRRALKHFGLDIGDFGGRHPYKVHRGGRAKYPLPLHALREELDDRYVAALCAFYGLDEGELRARLEGR